MPSLISEAAAACWPRREILVQTKAKDITFTALYFHIARVVPSDSVTGVGVTVAIRPSP